MTGTGAIIMGVFAAVWWVAGVRASGYGSPLIYAVAPVVTGLIIVAALRGRERSAQEPPEEHARRDRLVGIASAAEGVAILVAVNVLVNLGLNDYVAPVIAIIVGLHFVPLARLLPARLYYATAALLVALGVCGFAMRRPDLRLLVVSVGAACVLWLTCAFVLGVVTKPGRANRTHEKTL
jgi:hypothetical protein